MQTEQYLWNGQQWHPELPDSHAADWLLVFGSVAREGLPDELKQSFPSALVCGCSTAGEIHQEEVFDDHISVTAIRFEKGTRVRGHCVESHNAEDSESIGQQLGQQLERPELRHVFVLSCGLNINGSALASGVSHSTRAEVQVTGGLSGDGADFALTHQLFNTQQGSNLVIAIGLYGDSLTIGHGSIGGWDPFGPDREVTRSVGNVLYELDNQSALSLYKTYLGDYAAGLPGTALRFPLSLSGEGVIGDGLVRTILAVDEAEQSMTFAGDIPQGCHARLMKANFDRLVDGAAQAAEHCVSLTGQNSELAILISCVGRKMVLQQRTEEEVESVASILGDQATLCGFYSYGEISPLLPGAQCALHNQTMTITTLAEHRD
jgi:hypothetical protein